MHDEIMGSEMELELSADAAAEGASALEGLEPDEYIARFEKMDREGTLEKISEGEEASSHEEKKENAPEEGGAQVGAGEEDSLKSSNAPEQEKEPGEEKEEQEQPYRVYQSQEEYQREMDRIIGRRLYEEKGKRVSLQSQYDELANVAAKLLGVDKGAVAEELKRQLREREAVEKGVDAPAYIANEEKKELEERRKRELSEMRAQLFRRDIQLQEEKLKKDYPSFDGEEAVKNRYFTLLLTELYDDPKTRETALKQAYEQVFAPEAKKEVALSEPKKAPQSPKKQTAQRVSEGAISSKGAATSRVSIKNMNAEEFKEFERKLEKGIITLT